MNNDMFRNREKTPHLLIDFSDLLQTNVFPLGQTFLKLVRSLPLPLPALPAFLLSLLLVLALLVLALLVLALLELLELAQPAELLELAQPAELLAEHPRCCFLTQPDAPSVSALLRRRAGPAAEHHGAAHRPFALHSPLRIQAGI